MNENTIVLKTDQIVIDLLTNINMKLDNLLNKGTGVINIPAPEVSKDVDVKTMANEVVNKIKEAEETVIGETTKEEKETETYKYTAEDVRAKLTSIMREGKQKEAKALITKYGAKKISELDPKHFAKVMEEAEAL
jgi:L-lactate utilization protein LutC